MYPEKVIQDNNVAQFLQLSNVIVSQQLYIHVAKTQPENSVHADNLIC